MESRRKIRVLCMAMAVCLAIPALIVYLVDPFYHYHEPWFGLKPYSDEKEYQIPGMLKNFEYDSILVGSSVVMSMNTDILDERFGCDTVKAVGSSASAPLLNYYMDIAFENHEIENVFYGMDVFSFYNDPNMQVVVDDVEFLVNDNPLDDIEYLWNMDILGNKVVDMIEISAKSDSTKGTLYQMNEGAQLGPESVLKMHCPGAGIMQERKPVDYQAEYVNENLSRIEKRVKENPDTNFYFMIPPYNVVWWDDAYEKGILDTYLHTLKACMKQLLPYNNVKFYKTEFNEVDTITDVYQYMDYIHGGSEVTGRMAFLVGLPEDEITLDTYEMEVKKLEDIFIRFRNRVEAEGYGFVYEGPIE